MEIGALTQKAHLQDDEEKMLEREAALSEGERDLLRKQRHISQVINVLRLETFFPAEDIDEMLVNNRLVSKLCRRNTLGTKQLEAFAFTTEWTRILEGNKRLARKILDTINNHDMSYYE